MIDANYSPFGHICNPSANPTLWNMTCNPYGGVLYFLSIFSSSAGNGMSFNQNCYDVMVKVRINVTMLRLAYPSTV